MTFGAKLREHRLRAGLSLAGVGKAAGYDRSYLSQIERGIRPATRPVVEGYERALGTGGKLMVAYQSHIGEDTMRRRTMLTTLGALAVGGGPVALDALRRETVAATGGDTAARDEWEHTVVTYGYAYYTTPPADLLTRLASDLHVLNALTAGEVPHRGHLLTVSARLSALGAMTLAAAGDLHSAARWWATARDVARQSGDVTTRVLVGSWNVVNGCYDGRPLAEVVAKADRLLTLAHGQPPTAAEAGARAGRAQALALAGRAAEAEDELRRVADVTDRLPHRVTSDTASLWGWPVHRLLHTQSYVHTHTGDLAAAERAQDAALALYPASQVRLRAQVQLHQAARLVRGGDIPGGVRHAADVLDALPAGQRNRLVWQVAGHVVATVPEGERRRPVVAELVDRLPVPA